MKLNCRIWHRLGKAKMSLLRITSEGLKISKNRCLNLTVSEKELADLAFDGLRSYLKKKHSKALSTTLLIICKRKSWVWSLDSRAQKMSIILIGPYMLIVNLIRTMRKRKLLNSYGHQKLNHVLVHCLSRFQRIGKNKFVSHLMFLSVIVYLMNCLEAETSSCLMPYSCLRS